MIAAKVRAQPPPCAGGVQPEPTKHNTRHRKYALRAPRVENPTGHGTSPASNGQMGATDNNLKWVPLIMGATDNNLTSLSGHS
jgi:hypothetical protein